MTVRHERKAMKLLVDREADALLRLDDSRVVESQEVSSGIVLDYNEDNQVVGIEVLRLSERTPHLDLEELQYKSA